MIELDGAYLEGGGQILRTAVGLSTLTGEGCRIFNIRAGRSNPGLRSQHLKSIEACGKFCNARIDGLNIGSREVTYHPGEERTYNLEIDIGTAGSIPLLLQGLVLSVTRAEHPVHVHLKGGTHVAWSPTIEYFEHVFCNYIEQVGLEVAIEVIRYGFYPKGGGEVKATVYPADRLTPLNLARREGAVRLAGWSLATENLEEARVAERQLEGAENVLDLHERNISYCYTFSSGTALLLTAEFDNCVLGASQLGRRGRPSEAIGTETARQLNKLTASDATVDEYMADQILPYLSLAGGSSTVVAPFITDHARTNMWVIEKYLNVRFRMEEKENGTVILVKSH